MVLLVYCCLTVYDTQGPCILRPSTINSWFKKNIFSRWFKMEYKKNITVTRVSGSFWSLVASLKNETTSWNGGVLNCRGPLFTSCSMFYSLEFMAEYMAKEEYILNAMFLCKLSGVSISRERPFMTDSYISIKVDSHLGLGYQSLWVLLCKLMLCIVELLNSWISIR